MDFVAIVGAALLGVLLSPSLLRLVVRVPALATAGYVSDEEPAITACTRRRAVRMVTPPAFALVAWRWLVDAEEPSTVVIPFLFLAAVLVVISVIDLEHYRIPDRIVFPALGISAVLIALVTAFEGFDVVVLRNAVIGSLAYFVLLLVPHVIYPKGMGFGDVKLALLMGMYLGWIYTDPFLSVAIVLWALLLGTGLGVLVGVGFLVVRGRRAEFPFGPALAVGCLLATTFSETFVS
jgi:leader peptidase (prepilin peptidase)/N-methyltransferase